jgi:hypothetical protein
VVDFSLYGFKNCYLKLLSDIIFLMIFRWMSSEDPKDLDNFKHIVKIFYASTLVVSIRFFHLTISNQITEINPVDKQMSN